MLVLGLFDHIWTNYIFCAHDRNWLCTFHPRAQFQKCSHCAKYVIAVQSTQIRVCFRPIECFCSGGLRSSCTTSDLFVVSLFASTLWFSWGSRRLLLTFLKKHNCPFCSTNEPDLTLPNFSKSFIFLENRLSVTNNFSLHKCGNWSKEELLHLCLNAAWFLGDLAPSRWVTRIRDGSSEMLSVWGDTRQTVHNNKAKYLNVAHKFFHGERLMYLIQIDKLHESIELH